jgi:WhiA C-terminal HTH domain
MKTFKRLARANADRTAEAGPRLAGQARQILATQAGKLTPRQRQALELRAAHPDLSWADLAAKAGVTRDVLTSACRNARLNAGLVDPWTDLDPYQALIGEARDHPDRTKPELARKHGVSVKTVSLVLDAAGVTVLDGNDKRSLSVAAHRAAATSAAQNRERQRQRQRQNRDAQIIQMARDGAYTTLIVEQLQIDKATVTRVLRDAGVEAVDGRTCPRGIKPCGTPAAIARHRMHKQPLDPICRQAYEDGTGRYR